MNKIFKVIWSQTTQSWVTVSELNKAKGKTKSSYLSRKGVFKFSLISSALLFSNSQVLATVGDAYPIKDSVYSCYYKDGNIVCGDVNTSATGNSIAMGVNATANMANSVVIGKDAKSVTKMGFTEATAIGYNSTAANDSVAIGSGASATGEITSPNSKYTGWATAVGRLSNASGRGAIALGNAASASGVDSAAMGYLSKATATYAYAFGSRAEASGVSSIAFGLYSSAKAMSGTAIGNRANAEGIQSVAVSSNAQAKGIDSIALGAHTQALNRSDVALGAYAATDRAVGTNSAEVNNISYGGFCGTSPVATVSVGNTYQKRTITNVAAGRILANSTDAINGSQLYIVANQLAEEIKNVKAMTGNISIVGGDGINVEQPVSNTYTVTAKTDGTTIKIDNGNITANTGKINEAPSSGSGAGVVTVSDADKGRLATVDNVTNAINSAGWVVNTGKADDQNSFDTTQQNHSEMVVSAGKRVNFLAGKNMEVKRDGSNITYATSENVTFTTVQVGGDNGPKITGDGNNIRVSDRDGNPTKITNVAPGVADTDAVNVSQLKGATANINNQLNKMDKRRKAGHASGLAAAGLMQAYREGQSAVTAGVAQYQNESAVAVGYSRIADSGKYGVKASFSANTQGEVGGAVSAGYFW